MINWKNLRIAGILILLTGLSLSQASALSTGDRIMSRISFRVGKQYSETRVSFNFPVRYLRHYPLEFGRELRIQIEPIAAGIADLEGLSDRQSLFPPTNNPVGLRRVEYEGGNLIEPTIRIVFDKPTRFDVKQGEDFRSIIILVQNEEKFMESKKPAAATEPPGETPSLGKPQEKTSTEKIGKTSGAPEVEEKESAARPPGFLTEERQQSLLDEGEKVMAEENYSRAIQVYTKLLETADLQVRELAQFQLALAREKIGHMAHAKAEYRNYLREYPDGKWADEARDNLRVVLSARPVRLGDSKAELAESDSPWQSEFFGGVSMYYERDESFYEDEDGEEEDELITNVSSLITDVDATWRLFGDGYTIETTAIGSYEGDFIEGRDNEIRSSALYIDYEDTADTINTRLGRQTSSTGGVLGRFDGGRFGYQFAEKVRLNLVAGFPVDRSSDGLETDRYFYGINFDFGRFAEHWDFNTYFINQVAESIDDRRAVGGEVRFVSRQGSFYSLLDYDILFDDMSIFLFAGNYLLPNDKTRLNFSADFRSSPIISTNNALIGQFNQSLESLVDQIGEDAVRELARDRSLDSSFVSLGVSHPITQSIQIAADVSWSRLDGSPASGGVPAFDSTGDEFYYSLQLIGSGLVKDRDLSNMALRYADTKFRDTYTFILNSRYPINDMWRINPKLQIDYRKNKVLEGEQWRLRPGLRLEYILSNRWRFEIEGEYSWADKELPGIAEDRKGYAISLGFRYDF